MEQNNYTPDQSFNEQTVPLRPVNNDPLPTYEQPAYQQPTYQQPTYEQPVYQQPTYEQPAYQQPTYQQPVYQQPTYQPTYQAPVQEQPIPADVTSHVSSAFTKSLIAVIISELPIGSIIGLILSILGRKSLGEANRLAAYYGCKTGGKAVAAKVLSIVGMVLSIVYTVFWLFYIGYFVLVFGVLMAAGM